jgi:translation elongation factor EF-Tu-like GTPase
MFEFTASTVFGMVRRGTVFRGRVIAGEIAVGDVVKTIGRHRTHTARVGSIAIDRVLHSRSRSGVELGLLVTNFDEAAVQAEIMAAADEDEMAPKPLPEDILAIELPVRIFGGNPKP